MKFEKGRQKTGGRKKGVCNKTSFSRARINELVTEQFDTFVETLCKLSEEDPKAYVGHMVKLLSYVVPTLQSTTLEDKTERGTKIDDMLRKLSGE